MFRRDDLLRHWIYNRCTDQPAGEQAHPGWEFPASLDPCPVDGGAAGSIEHILAAVSVRQTKRAGSTISLLHFMQGVDFKFWLGGQGTFGSGARGWLRFANTKSAAKSASKVEKRYICVQEVITSGSAIVFHGYTITFWPPTLLNTAAIWDLSCSHSAKLILEQLYQNTI